MDIVQKLQTIQADVEAAEQRLQGNKPDQVPAQARQSAVSVEYNPRYSGQAKASGGLVLPTLLPATGAGEVPVYQPRTVQAGQLAGLTELKALLKKDRLPASDIRRARTLIESYVSNKAGAYLKLQYMVNYQNQRDAQVKGYSRWEGTYGNWQNVGNEMCNLSSLGMGMLYMGITKDDVVAKLLAWGYQGKLPQQYDDLLELLRQEMAKTKKGYANNPVGTFSRDVNTTLKTIAESFGLKVETNSSIGKRGQEWYKENILSELQKGNAAILSYRGHIVRIQDVTDKGIVVDDPFGKVEIKPGSAIKIPWDNKNNNSKDNARIVGEDRVLPWSEVEAHGMYWVQVLKWK